MRKLISLLLALVMVMSFATVAFAADDYKTKLDIDPVLKKTYTEESGDAPAETFTFKVEGVSFVDNEGNPNEDITIPAIDNLTMAYTGTAEMTATIDLNAEDFPVIGKYTYMITEVIPEEKTAGTTYEQKPIYMVVTVLYDEGTTTKFVAALHYETVTGDKTTGFTNSYAAGQLAVKKVIAGNAADMTAKFPFSVTFTADENCVFDANVQVLTDTETTQREYVKTSNTDGTITITFELGHNETATFTNIPVGTSYVVSETPGAYTSSWTENQVSGDIAASAEKDEVSVTNTLTTNVDTGITLDSIPFVVMMVVCAAAAVLFIIKRRSVEF